MACQPSYLSFRHYFQIADVACHKIVRIAYMGQAIQERHNKWVLGLPDYRAGLILNMDAN